MEFKDNKNLRFIDSQLADEPHINVIDKEDFEKRVEKVFNILWEKLSRSFGPGGAGTFVSVYPSCYNTKDGFSIMKQIGFDTKLDQVISDLVMNICTRLNFTVGDGTTTAVIATKTIYDAYRAQKSELEKNHVLPRVVMQKLEIIKNEILKRIDENAVPIRTENRDELREDIARVVDISSNNNKEITDIISNLYAELGYPAITCGLSNDGITKSYIVEGYKMDVTLTDKIYINNDNNNMLLEGADYIIFDHKVTESTYKNILQPLSQVIDCYGRHLVCIAPFYDEMALNGVIARDLNNEYKQKKKIPLVLTVCSKVGSAAKKGITDLAMLLNTSVITSSMEEEFTKKFQETSNVYSIFNIDMRRIPDIVVGMVKQRSDEDDNRPSIIACKYIDGMSLDYSANAAYAKEDDLLRIGYCDRANIGLKESSFSGFYYDKDIYDKFMQEAENEVKDLRSKCRTMGVYSPQLGEAQHRLFSLGLKMGVIEVGSTSEISQGYLKDTFDDAVKAAASAYNNGTVLGCNVTTLNIIDDYITEISGGDDAITMEQLAEILVQGFYSVYATVLTNAIVDTDIHTFDEAEEVMRNYGFKEFTVPKEYRESTIVNMFINDMESNGFALSNLIIDISGATNTVFNLTTGKFDKDVINSAETDKEIIKAVIDLLSLLITGNQMVLC